MNLNVVQEDLLLKSLIKQRMLHVCLIVGILPTTCRALSISILRDSHSMNGVLCL